jgi:hypothetical protein
MLCFSQYPSGSYKHRKRFKFDADCADYPKTLMMLVSKISEFENIITQQLSIPFYELKI